MPMNTGFCITRYLTPFTSAGVVTGRALFIMWRNPPSKNASPIRFLDSSLASMDWPIGPSSTRCAVGASG